MEILLFVGGVVLFLGMLMTWPNWAASRSRELVERWAKVNGFQLVRSEVTGLHSGIFPGYVRGQVILSVRVRNAHGGFQDAWIRCGGTALGFHLSEVEVRWTEPGRSAFI